MIGRSSSIEIKTSGEIQAMRAAGTVVAIALDAMAKAAKPGVTSNDLDAIARDVLSDNHATSSFLGYHGFPAVICASVNDEVVHGIPSDRPLRDGDLISIDFGAIVDGWHGDAAVSVLVGEVTAEVAELSRVTEASMWAGLAQVRAGHRLTDISHAVERSIRAAGEQAGRDYGIVEEYGGHGIGSSMHMAPHILNYGKPGKGPRLEVGMALAIEPMVTLGKPAVSVLDDDWTVVTRDGQWASHWEHTVAVTEDGPWVLTALNDVRL